MAGNKQAALSFLPGGGNGAIPSGPIDEIGEGDGAPLGTPGSNEGFVDARTIDPAQISKKRGRRGGRKWTPEQRAAARERWAAKRTAAESGDEKETLAIDEPEPPEVPPNVVGQVALALQFLHGLGPAEFAISDNEAEKLAKALTDVSRYYVKFTVSNKGAAWLALIYTVYMIEGPRFHAFNERKKAKPAGESVRETGGLPMPSDMEVIV